MAYMMAVEFEWDDDKGNACFVRCGFDCAYAVRLFFDPHRTVVQDRRWDDGEDRYRTLGMIEERVYVVFTVWGSATRVISARKTNAKEVGDYEHHARED